MKADPIAIVSTPPVHRLENRIKIPKPTLKHHCRRTGAGVVPINIGPNPTSSYHRTSLFGGRFVHIMCTAFGRWMRTSTHRSPPLSYFISLVSPTQATAHILCSPFSLTDGEFAWRDSIGRGSLCYLESRMENSGGRISVLIFRKPATRVEGVIVFEGRPDRNRFDPARPSPRK